MTAKSLPGVNYLMMVGIVLIVFGIVAIATPAVAGTAVVIVIGVLLLLAGVAQVFHGLREPTWSSKLLPLIAGIITSLGGLAVLAHPLLGLKVLTLVLAMFFIVEGIWKIIVSFSFRPASGWLAILASGLLAFVLGFLIWRQWPLSGMWAVGVLVGVDLVMTGCALLALSITIRQASKAALQPSA